MKKDSPKSHVAGRSLWVVCLLVAAATGCSLLDLRNESVMDRVRRHEGDAWQYHRKDEPKPGPGNSFECASPRKAAAAAAADVPWAAGSVCLSPEEQDTNTMPGCDVTPTPEDARKKYLYGKTLYLSADHIEIEGAEAPIRLELVNDALNCLPPGRDDDMWPCRIEPDRKVPNSAGKTFKRCRSFIHSDTDSAVNFLGVLEDRYCVTVKLAEEKLLEKKTVDWPTKIERDSLIVEFTCATTGNGSPRAVVIGPKPSFISPAKAVPSE